MSSTSTTTTTTEILAQGQLKTGTVLKPQQTGYRMQVDGSDPAFYNWRDDLVRDGYAIVNGAVPAERALRYADQMYSLLESFRLGYDRNDPSTVHPDKLPVISEKGMLLPYGACHEDFVWGVRGEPGVVGAFEKVYGTEDLLVSFDTINYGFHNREKLPANKPWPHQDQDPDVPGFLCLQGLVNLLPNGPNDGGLIVCKGAHLLSEQFHDEMRSANEDRIPAWTREWYGFTDKGIQWLKDHGCEWVKVEAEPGDLLLWDSRTPHYNVAASGQQDRLAVYTCYMPVADATQQDLVRKKYAWDRKVGTTHWPNVQFLGTNKAMRGGKPDSVQRYRPLNEPVLGERAFKLTGIPYLQV